MRTHGMFFSLDDLFNFFKSHILKAMISHTWFYLNVFLKYKKRIHKPWRKFGNKEVEKKNGKWPIITPLLAPQE